MTISVSGDNGTTVIMMPSRNAGSNTQGWSTMMTVALEAIQRKKKVERKLMSFVTEFKWGRYGCSAYYVLHDSVLLTFLNIFIYFSFLRFYFQVISTPKVGLKLKTLSEIKGCVLYWLSQLGTPCWTLFNCWGYVARMTYMVPAFTSLAVWVSLNAQNILELTQNVINGMN